MLYLIVSHDQRTKKTRKQEEERKERSQEGKEEWREGRRDGGREKERERKRKRKRTMSILTFVRLEFLNHSGNHCVRGTVEWS